MRLPDEVLVTYSIVNISRFFFSVQNVSSANRVHSLQLFKALIVVYYLFSYFLIVVIDGQKTFLLHEIFDLLDRIYSEYIANMYRK